ncbi:MAG: alpha/beta hydrolase [Polaribacter sp.]
MTNETILSVYDKKLASLPIHFNEVTIATSLGKTNVLIFGDATKPSLFLLHGLNSAAPFAFDTVSFLVEKYQIFAIDILGQPNKSDFVRLNKKNTSYGKWLQETVCHFNLGKITLCGISFGAFPILQSLLIDEKKVKEVFLISPAGIVNGSLLKTITRFLIPMKKFKKTKSEVSLKQCLLNLYDEFDDFNLQFLKEVFLNFKMDFSITPNFKKSELSSIKTPITIISSKNDFFVPGQKLKKRSEKSFTSLKKYFVLENANHIPKKEVLENYFYGAGLGISV